MVNHKGNSISTVFKRSLIGIAVMGAVGVTHAQESTNGEEADDIEQIEVRGIRASSAKNLSIKRLSNTIVDAITAEDIGKFPDKNVADSLQRVPGVVITRSGGEGSQVSIRGLSEDLTFTQLNGNYLASSPGSPSRSFNFALLPSTMVERVEVHKSSEARLDEGGVGGTIVVHSRKPLNMDANSGVVNLEYTYADVTEDWEPGLSGIYSWKNEDEDFGFLVGYTRQKRTNRSLSGTLTGGGGIRFATNGDADPETGIAPAYDVNGNVVADSSRRFGALTDAYGRVYDGVWVPQVAGVSVFKEERVRTGVQATMQYAVSDNLEFTFNYFQFSLGEDATNSQMWMPEWKYNANFMTDVHLDSTGTIVTGVDFTTGAGGVEGNMEFPWMLGSYLEEEDTSDTFDLGMTYEADDYTLTAKIGHTEAEGGPTEAWSAAYKSGEPASRSETGVTRNAASYAGWRIGDNVSLYADPMLLTNLQAGIGGDPDPGSTGSSFIKSNIEEDYAQLDFDIPMDWGWVSAIKTGAKYRKASLQREFNNTLFLTQEGIDLIESGQLDPNDGPIEDYMYQWIGGMPNFANVLNAEGEQNIPGGFSVNIMPTIDWNQYRDVVTSQYHAYTREEPELTYDIEEEITAAYIQADFAHNDFRGNFGLRYVETTNTVTSTDTILLLLDDIDDELYDATEDVNVSTTSGNDRAIDFNTPIQQEVTDKQLLPSFNFIWDVDANLVVRFAAAKTMSRPDFNQMGERETLTFTSQEWADDRATIRFNPVDQGWQGGGGNKALKPYESIQTDLSAEYYYGEGSGMGIAFFNKEVDNFIVPLVITSTRPSEGFTHPDTGMQIVPAGDITVSPFSTSANGTDATSRGVELFAQHNFDNGFGFNTNYTYNDTNQANVSLNGEKVGESALTGSADNQFNFSAYYENDLFSVRASYNRRGQRTLGLADGLTVYAEPYQQVDVNASYNIMEDLIFSASVINLTEEETRNHYGDDTKTRLHSSGYTGRRFYAGVSYRF